MGQTTTYYEFNKPEGTDLVNPLVDTNPNWDALDADLHEFNERSIANCSEIVALGVHTISRLDTTAKFLKWIATANFTSGETFTVDGLPVAATTPAGAALATNAYVTGSVVLACLNADNTAMTVFVSGTTIATDSERLGGELPSYYGKASDVSDNSTDITNLQNQVGNTSIVGIGDGTCTGAIYAISESLATGSVSVTADGLKTLPQILNQLYAACDTTKIKADSYITYNDIVFRFVEKNNGDFIFSTLFIFNNTNINFYTRTMGASSAARNCNIDTTGSVTITNLSTNVPAADTVFTLYY